MAESFGTWCFFILFIYFFSRLPLILGAAWFVYQPPNPLYILQNDSAVIKWSYFVDNKTELDDNSPVWEYKKDGGTWKRIAFEDANDGWKWKISNDCPAKFKIPVLRVGKGEANASLVIQNTIFNDRGFYRCKVQLLAGSPVISDELKLVVTVPPKFNPQPPPVKTIVEGQDLILSCTAIGPPTPDVTWVHMAGHVSAVPGNATLRVTDVKRDQNGSVYKCQARNNPNERPITAHTVVKVYYQPSIMFDTLLNQTVIEKESLSIRCDADGFPSPTIKWKTPTGSVHTGNVYSISSVSRSHAGTYTCTASNGIGNEATANIQVVVQYQPSILHDKLKNQVLNESDSLSIRCDADGNPTPTIKWKTPTGSVHTGNVYSIPSVSRSHAGTYTCTASNGIGREATATAQVTVQYPPSIDASKSNLTSNSWDGNNIRLVCFATGIPAPKISWYKPTGVIVPGGSEVTVLTTADQGDYGQYKCRATNILGSDEHVINVTQLFPPNCSSFAMAEGDIEASSITVRWNKPDYDGGSPVTGYKVHINTSNPLKNKYPSDTNIMITGLTRNTKYKVEVFAKNIAGYGRRCIKIITTKKLGKPAVPELTVTRDQAAELSVRLSWTKPDDNGKEITEYTIYMKEDDSAEFAKIDDVLDPEVLEYTVTKNMEHGKTYKFVVTAWNELGESEYDDSMVKSITIPEKQIPSNKDKRTSNDGGSNDAVIAGAVGAVLFMLLVALILGVIIIRKKGLLSKGFRRKSSSNRAAYDNDIDLDSAANQQAGGSDEIPTYAAVDISKKKKKKTAQEDIPNYAVVDKNNKRPGEIIYAELADFNTAGTEAAAAPRPIAYTSTDYADITQFQKQWEQEPTYANFPGCGKNYTNIQGM